MGGKSAIKGSGLFQSWLDYCEAVRGETRADVIRRVVSDHGVKTSNAKFYQYLVAERPVPDSMLRVINSDLVGIISYLVKDLKQDPTDLAASLMVPTKHL